MTTPFRIAVLASGGGTNLQAIIDQLHSGDEVEVVCVTGDNPDAGAFTRAHRATIDTAAFLLDSYDSRYDRDTAMADWIDQHDVGLVVLAGFMQLLTPAFLDRFPRRVINIHPALLPAFPGINSIERALDHGVKVTGVTVHFVDHEMDNGPIILQEAVPVPYPPNLSTLESLIHDTEHRLLPEAIRLIARGDVQLSDNNPRFVHIQEQS